MSKPSSRQATIAPVVSGTSVGASDLQSLARPISAKPLSGESSSELDEDTFLSLEALSRKAASESMRAKGAPRDGIGEDQFDSLAMHLLAIGKRAYLSFDRALTASTGDAFNHAYRFMLGFNAGRFTYGPYTDWLRTNVRDSRFEPAGTTSVTASGELPESATLDPESLDQAIRDVSAGLSNHELWTLHHLARPIAERAAPLVLIARKAGLSVADARQRMEDLHTALAPSVNGRAPIMIGDAKEEAE